MQCAQVASLQQPACIPFVQHAAMISPIPLARDSSPLDQEVLGPTFDYRTAGSPVPHPGHCAAVECIPSTPALDLVSAMQWAEMSMTDKHNRFHRASPTCGAVRDSRSIATGQ